MGQALRARSGNECENQLPEAFDVERFLEAIVRARLRGQLFIELHE